VTELPARDKSLLKDLADRMPCYSQMRDGWYTDSCFEAGKATRNCCDNCRMLKRVRSRLEQLSR
jgi:hypothetical protein